ncbi:cellulose binding domain-containing protein [Nonomuraea sp. SBT364]|uniref:cellulose binding domain-containing protein n=1 Tax=Nonomuraea sp. SBT364 TaxID=1580530 RepID=UPI00066B110C|nr:cellulose binding domain-containing protein [Nonomuraea sp. SBT364]
MARTRVRLASMLASMAAMLMLTAGAVFLMATPASAAPVRIMPLGDSITGSPGCWRALLWNKLRDGGHTNVDFVGTLPAQGCSVPYDGDNEGHGGALVTTVANQNQLVGWLAASTPDVVLMHFGTNDVWSNVPPATILAAYTKLVGQMRASNPAMRILVAKIIPMAPSSCAECGARAVALNDAIPGWAAATSTQQSPVVVVDQWTGFSTGADTYDGVHPNAAGDQKIADRWYPALVDALSGTPTVSPTATPTVTSTVPPGGCSATFRNAGQWQGGFQGEVTVTNTGVVPLNGWTVRWTFADGQRVSQLWNGTLTTEGAAVTVRNTSWNGALGGRATTTFGFLASWTGANTPPTPTCTTG